MQDNQTLTTIKAKQKLGLPLTDHERAMFTLYGENTPVTDAETAARAELCATIIAPILDVLVPIIDAIALRAKRTSPEETISAMNEYARKGAFVEKYLSPMLAAAKAYNERERARLADYNELHGTQYEMPAEFADIKNDDKSI